MSDANVFARFRFQSKRTRDDNEQPDPPPPLAARDLQKESKSSSPAVRTRC